MRSFALTKCVADEPEQLGFDQIVAILGQPYYHAPGVALYCGDALTYLRKLPHKGIPLTVTSPPYNIGKEYERPRPLDEYIAWCAEWLRLIYDATDDRGAFWLNVGYVPVEGRGKAVPLPYLLWDKTNFFLVQEVVWHYGAGVAARRSFSPRNEKFLWYVRDAEEYTFNLDDIRDPNVKYPLQSKNGKLKCNPLGKNPTDVWSIPKVTSGRGRASKERTPHPAQFPTAVIERIVRGCSNKGDVVLDPFVGSGSAVVAAHRHGRCALGFEQNERYLELAVRRIADADATLRLFGEDQ